MHPFKVDLTFLATVSPQTQASTESTRIDYPDFVSEDVEADAGVIVEREDIRGPDKPRVVLRSLGDASAVAMV